VALGIIIGLSGLKQHKSKNDGDRK